MTVFILLAFILGCNGYYQMYFVSPDIYFGTDHSFSYLDILYSTLNLYILESGADAGSYNWPTSVQIARFLAPVGIGWAAIRAVIVLLSDQISHYLMGRLNNHVIVAGSGTIAKRLIQEFSHDHDIVHIRPEHAFNTRSHTGDRIFYVEGIAMTPEILKTARLHMATRVFLTWDTESENRSSAFAIANYLKGELNADKKIPCHMMLGGAANSVRASKEIITLNNHMLTIKLFNPMRLAARKIIRDHPPHLMRLPDENDTPLHALLVGFGKLGQEIFKQLIRVCHYADCQKIRITVVDSDNYHAWKRFLKETPDLCSVTEATYVETDACTIDLWQWDELQGLNRGAFDVAYITLSDRDDSYTIASDARHGFGSGIAPCQAVVCSTEEMDHGSLDSCRNPQDSKSHVLFLDLKKSSWTREYICDEKYDDEAKEIHRNYLLERKKEREKHSKINELKAKPAEVPWEKLEEYLKDSNRDQADHNLVKESIFEQKGITRKQAIVLGVNHPDLFELMAKIEHRRWMASTVITGFRYGTDRVDNKRTHPNLQNPELSFEEHYAQLDNGIKEYDRAMIRKFIHNWDPK